MLGIARPITWTTSGTNIGVTIVKTLSGRYRLRYPVGRGGMAVVWRADDMVLKRTVAVKVLHPHLPGNAWVRRRILAEAMAAGRLNHPHIARVYDYGETTEPDGTCLPYLVLEFVDGPSLATTLGEDPMPWPSAAATCAPVADALATAHAQGLVHRDVKAANILRGTGGVKVVDFGVAAEIGADLADPSGHVWATPGCLAPECLRERTATPAADVFALGLLIMHCLTGNRPNASEIRPVDVETLFQRFQDIPPALTELVRDCLRLAPDDRPTAATVASRLRNLARLDVPTNPEPNHLSTTVPSPQVLHRPGRMAGAAGAGLALAATAALAVALLPSDSAGANEDAAASTSAPVACRTTPAIRNMPAQWCRDGISATRAPASRATATSAEPDVAPSHRTTSSRSHRSTPLPARSSRSPVPHKPSATPTGVATRPTATVSTAPSSPAATPTSPAPITTTPSPAPSSSAPVTPSPTLTSASPAQSPTSAASATTKH